MRLTRLATAVIALAGGTLAFAATRSTLQEMEQPSAQHEELVASAGQWEGTITTYFEGEQTAPARETVVAIGGFWTQARFECQFMGTPYVGTGCVGYDAKRGKYVGTWIDSMSSYMCLMEGEIDPTTKKLVMRYEAPGPPMGELVPHRIETEHKGDSYTSTFYMGEGEGMKGMVIAMKRKAAGAR